MKRQSRVFTTAAMFVILCTASPARAAEPLESWVVGPIDASSSSGLPYCSMKNVYEGGLTLVFARDTAGGNSIAVDFGKPMLPPGKQYPALVEAGFEARNVPAVAATDSVLLVQMGHDPEFYDTLAAKSVMQLGFDSHSFSFGLKGSADALTELDECTQTLTAGISRPEKPLKPDEEKISEEKLSIGQLALESTLKDEVERLEAEKRRLLLENQIIAAQAMQKEKSDLEKLRLENERLKKELKAVAGKAPPETGPDSETETVSAAKTSPKPRRKPAAPPETANVSSRKPVAEETPAMLPSLLRRAGVVAREKDGAFTWQSAGVFGAAIEKPLSDTGDLQTAIDAYAEEARARCAGDFAHNAGAVIDLGGLSAVKAEMACIDGEDDAAAAVLYVADKTRFAILTQEGAADKMEQALHHRDMLAGSLKK